MDITNFTAIDFETMTAERTSACAIGIVRVENCVITQKFYSLINPIPDDRDKNNVHVHGITPEMVSEAPTWAELWPVIHNYFINQVIVCHNRDFDFDILKKISDYYDINFTVALTIDTMWITHASLADSCANAGIPLESHHDALCDATACARVMLASMGVEFKEHHFEKMTVSGRRKRALSSETKQPLDDNDVQNKETPFYKKKVVLTGLLSSYPEREEIANILKRYGADINTSISSKTNYVIVGSGAGPSKMRKIEELNAKGSNIIIMYEPELLEILEKYGII